MPGYFNPLQNYVPPTETLEAIPPYPPYDPPSYIAPSPSLEDIYAYTQRGAVDYNPDGYYDYHYPYLQAAEVVKNRAWGGGLWRPHTDIPPDLSTQAFLNTLGMSSDMVNLVSRLQQNRAFRQADAYQKARLDRWDREGAGTRNMILPQVMGAY